ncbi:Ankyrin repeat domain-containing protein 50-like protein 3, partial [Colletotrichum plurivorum]
MYDPNTKKSGDDNKSGADSNSGPLKRDCSSEPDSGTDNIQPRKKRKIGVDRPEGNAPVATEDYRVGWVCALPLEMAAAKGMLDQVHPNLARQDPADHNSYVLGQVQGHNVVIACLPAGIYGTTPAATVAKDLLRTFKSIRFGLMVGIGGGVPSRKHDIRLGDIVVSQPNGTSGGVIQYDRGKTVQEGEFQRTGSLNTPPQVLLAALSRLQADHLIENSRIPQFVSELVGKSPKIMKKKFCHQGALHDHLFQAEYDHVDPDSTCDECDHKQIIQREDRDDTHPVIHYGNIASGNQAIKHGETRDKLSKELGVLCFEMEAAGLQDFPSLVIRGVCDYADSHKNKRWQEYAAATAAAFAKELLSVIPPDRVLQERPIPQLVSDPRLHEIIEEQTQKQEVRYESQKQVDCHQTFKTSTYEKFKNINPDRVPGTCKWVLEHPRYQTWQQSRHDDLLWISADPGCGKSVLAKSLIDQEIQQSNEHTVCYFFFKDNDDQNNLATALCALLHQLFYCQPLLIRQAMAAFEKNGEKLQTEVDELWRIFVAAATQDKAVNDIESEFRDIPEPQTIRLAGEESNADISEEINLDQRFETWVSIFWQTNYQYRARDGLNSVHLAALNGHDEVLSRLLALDDCASNLRDNKGETPLIWGSLEGRQNSVQTLLNKGADVNAQGGYYGNALQAASSGGHGNIVQMLLERGADVNAQGGYYDNALQAASSGGHGNIVQMLLDKGADVNAQGGHDNIVQMLLDKGADVNAQGGDYGNALHVATSGGHDNIVQMLLDKGADVNAQGGYYGNALQAASSGGYNNIVQKLLERGADVNAQGGHYDNALQAASSGGHDNIVQMLLERGADVNAQGGHYDNALYAASLEGHGNIVQMLLEKGADVNAEGGYYGNALHVASLEGHNNIVQLLLNKGADVNAQGGDYKNALCAASSRGHDNIVQTLLNKGADVNTQGGHYDNALYAASLEGHGNIVQMLLDKGADFTVPNDGGWTPLNLAAHSGHLEVVKLLLD